MSKANPTETSRQWRVWFDSPLGRSLQAIEVNHLRNVLAHIYGTTAAQLGRIGQFDMMDACIAPTRILLDPEGGREACVVRGTSESLPFDSKSLDVVLLPHTLDFCADPHQVLREVSRVLRPDGHVVILGFNPTSVWGFRRLFTRRPRPAPWCGNFFRIARIKDWLGLLDFETMHGKMLFYRPPVQSEGAMYRLHFLDKMGDRWWPMMAAVYLVVAKKRVLGTTAMPLHWKKKRVVGRAVAAAGSASRGMVIPFNPRRVRRPG